MEVGIQVLVLTTVVVEADQVLYIVQECLCQAEQLIQ